MSYVLRVTALLMLALSAGMAHADTYFTEDQVKQQLFPDAELTERPLNIDTDLLKDIKRATSARLITNSLKVWEATRQGNPAGWLFNAEVLGKHENIRYALALDTAGKITQMEIMEYRETHGGEVADLAWRSQLFGMSLSNKFKLGKDVDNISGATLSCRHLTDGIHGLLIVHDRLLKH